MDSGGSEVDHPPLLDHDGQGVGLQGHRRSRGRPTGSQAPFSYLTLYCPIVNENCGPKQVTHHMFYSVQKIAVVQRKKRVVLTLPHRISNPKSLISLQPTKAFMRLS